MEKNISCIENIPFTKITIKGDTLQRIKEMTLILENILLIITIWNQLLSLVELVKHYESKSKMNFSDNIFWALLSVYPDGYTITLLGNEYYISMHDVTSRIYPSILKIRYDKLELLLIIY